MIVVLVILLSALLCLSITRQSLWIDEGAVVWFASHQGVQSMFHAFENWGGGERQMPLYLLYMQAWVTLFGRGEYLLRASNLPFAFLLVMSLAWASRALFRRPYAWAVLCTSPFVWFYLNEARPYVALITCSTITLIAVLAYYIDPAKYERTAPLIGVSSFVFAWGIHMLAVFIIPSVVLLLGLRAQSDSRFRSRHIVREWVRPLGWYIIPLLLLGTYYAWTIRQGAGGIRGAPSVNNLLSTLYDFLGFMGLGPPRNELRTQATASLLLTYWPWILLGVVACLSIGMIATMSQQRRLIAHLVASGTTGLVLAFVATALARFQFRGRHMAALFPFFLLMLLLMTDVPNRGNRRLLAALSLGILALAWTASDSRLLLLPAYHKDAYRSAAAMAATAARAHDAEILWAADPMTAYYYGLHVDAHDAEQSRALQDLNLPEVFWPATGTCTFAANWTREEALNYLAHVNHSIILVVSKPDLYDSRGAWDEIVREQKPSRVTAVNAFRIYEFTGTSQRLIGD